MFSDCFSATYQKYKPFGPQPGKAYIFCGRCNIYFKNKKSYLNHLTTDFHNNGKYHTFICDKCDMNFSKYHCFVTHVINPKSLCYDPLHENPRTFVCSTCAHTFYTRNKLKLHQSFAHPSPILTCTVCTKLKPCHAHATWNIVSRRIKSLKIIRCRTCNKLFQGRRTISEHIKAAHFNDNNQCKVCLVDYPKRSILIEHYIAHHTQTMENTSSQVLLRQF